MAATPTTETKQPQPAAPAKVKLEAVRPVRVGDKTYSPGEQFEVTEEEAAWITKKFQGVYSFGGERHNAEQDRHEIVRAKRVS